MSATQTLQVISITTALLASGGIAALSLFDMPTLKAQPASRSLPTVRWLFSRGSHVFPTAGVLSSSTFAYLSWSSLPHFASPSVRALLRGKSAYYLAAAALCVSIAPITSLAMVPTNFALIRRNEALGGARSAKSAEYRLDEASGARSAQASVESEDDVSQWRDGSVPQERTERESSEQEDRDVRELLDRFAWLNMLRALVIGAGGVVGLVGALA